MEELMQKIKDAITSTDCNDVYSIGMRNAFKYVISLIDGNEPQYEEVKTTKHGR